MSDLHDLLRSDFTAIRNRLDTVQTWRALTDAQRDAVESARRRAALGLSRLDAVAPPAPPAPTYSNPYPTHAVHRPLPADPRQVEGVTPRPGIHLDHGAEAPRIYRAGEGVTWSVQLPGAAVSVVAPADIAAGTGTDHALVLIDLAAGYEVRLWRAVVDAQARRITCANGNLIELGTHRVLTGADVTGSGMSYTVGCVWLDELEAGVIPHALRVSASYIGGAFVAPATKTDQTGAVPPDAPMGARVYLPADVDMAPILTAIDVALPHPLHRRAARAMAVATQTHGMILSDGGGFANTVYVEGAGEERLTAVMGPPTGTYDGQPTRNAIGRAISAALPWERMRVTDDPRLG